MQSTVPSWNLVDSYPFRQPERVFFNPYDSNEMWVTSFGNGLKKGLMNPTAVPEISGLGSDCGIFPNPVKSVFDIRCSIFNNGKIELVDISGKFVRRLFEGQSDIKSLEFDVSDLEPGIYFLRIQEDNYLIVKKIIKI
jgi:hypothetical protein